jgi:hypothetical protein
LFGFIIASASAGLAICNNEGIRIWPRSGSIVPNQQFIIEGYASDRKVARGICNEYPVCLVSGGESVELEVKEICEGEVSLTQVILRPKTLLKSGSTYQIVIENLPESSTFAQYGVHHQRKFEQEWTVSGPLDKNPPAWKLKPIESEKHYRPLGCGPSLGVHFKAECADAKNKRVKTEVRPLGKTKWTTYYLPIDDKEIVIGRDMCSGAFSLMEAKEYEVQFSLVDMAGNVSPSLGAPIRFNRPEEMNQD